MASLKSLKNPHFPFKNESEFKKAVLDLAIGRGVRLNRRQAGTVFASGHPVFLGGEGWLDLDGFLPSGAFIAIETKAPRNTPSDTQWQFMQSVNQTPLGVAFWCSSIIHACEGIDHALAGRRVMRISRRKSGDWDWL